MKANELMLGDFVTFKDCQNDKEKVIIKIWEINQEGYALVFIDDNEVLDEFTIDEEFVGIPLTPEILERNGWKWNEYHTMMTLVVGSIHIGWGFYKDCLSISDYSDDGDCQITSLKCKYVHELQHALKLCRIEKKIEL